MTESGERPRLGGRYELGELLGRGGMAEVRKGTDIRLGRIVAIKRLRTDLVDDATFQARFRREAQSAASLNHPAIAAVYDTGEEQGPGDDHPHPYIVMEYVAGRTLREILREGRKILPERALEIVSGVLSALDYSHRAGIIHRDIKPANVMLNPSGDVKVMDFGIARAIADTSSTMTQTAAVIGTAQYLSPEQARGETVDSRSDVYSTGCLLYELLTGRPPFVGDSPVSVAYQHVREQAKPPSAIDSSLPPEIDAIVMKALAKRVEDRYQSAAAMRSDIELYLSGKPVTAPQPVIAAPIVDGPPQPTSVENTSIFNAVHDEEPATKRRWPLVLMGLLIAGLLVAAIVFGAQLFKSPPEQKTVPHLIGLTKAAAEQKIQAAGLVVGAETEGASSDVPVGSVISQDPSPLTKLAPDSEVDLVISVGPEQRNVPYVLGDDKETARQKLVDLGFRVRLIEEESSQPKDTVTKTDPVPGTPLDVGKVVKVYWASGPIEVPSVIGLTQEAATKALKDAGFQVEVVYDSQTESEKGTVLGQKPDALTEQPKGTTVIITVSSYVAPTETPTQTPTSTPTETPPPTPTAGGVPPIVTPTP
jgi:beta-lactam-binding protein with PASTA domain/tRNA A-37 threonylcarbamoyl transferase component Bud32